jgi:tetratricopeptide (TPR) repeat protein
VRDPGKLQAQSPQLLAALGNTLYQNKADALPLLTEARRQFPSDFWLNFYLGLALKSAKQWEAAAGFYRAALALRPETASVHSNLGNALKEKGLLDEAVREYRKALELSPKEYAIHLNLGTALRAQRKLDEAIKEYHEAIALDPTSAMAHNNLGNVLQDKKEWDAAITEYRAALALSPRYATAHFTLGNALREKGQLDEAITEYRKALESDPTFAEAHSKLGLALQARNQLDEAVTEFRKALGLEPGAALRHYNLGQALQANDQPDAAVTEYRAALDRDPTFARAHCNLGQIMRQQGQFVESLLCYRKGHEFGSRQRDWRFDSARWVRNAERLVGLEQSLLTVLSGHDRPANNADRLTLAWMCAVHKRLPAAAVRLYEEAFAAEAKAADDPRNSHRYNAARAAASAAAERGKDTGKLDANERNRLRKQALEWLRADLAYWTKQAEGGDAKARAEARKTLQRWQTDADLASLRDADTLQKLSESERDACHRFWDDVVALLKIVEDKQ